MMGAVTTLLLTILLTITTTTQAKQTVSLPSIHQSTIKGTMKDECPDLSFLNPLREKYQHQPTFLQAVEETALSLVDVFRGEDGEFYQRAFLAMAEPERVIAFRVPWEDDEGKIHFQRGWRVEFSRYVCVWNDIDWHH